MAGTVTIAQFQKAIDPAVQSYFFEELTDKEPKLKELFKVESQDIYNTTEQTLAGLGYLSAVSEGATIPVESPIEGYQTVYTPTKYAGRIEISYETKKFARMDLVAEAPKEAAKAAARTKEKTAAGVYIHSTNTAYTSYTDGKPLGSTIHPLADGSGTFANASTAGITLTDANLETGILNAEAQVSDRGNLVNIFFDTLVVPTALRREAIVITKSTQVSNSANNDVNVYNSGTIAKMYGGVVPNIVVWSYLGTIGGGSDTRWFLLDSNNHMIKFKVADEFKVESDMSVGFNTDKMTWKVRGMFDTGWSNPRGFYVSNGDGQAYSS